MLVSSRTSRVAEFFRDLLVDLVTAKGPQNQQKLPSQGPLLSFSVETLLGIFRCNQGSFWRSMEVVQWVSI